MGVPVPQIKEDGLPVVPQERTQNCTPEQISGVPVPQIMEAPVDVMLFTSQERVQNRTPEQISGVPVPQIMEAPVNVMPFTPQERVQHRTSEQIMDVPFLRSLRSACRIVRWSTLRDPQCLRSWRQSWKFHRKSGCKSRTQEQILDLPVPPIMVASKAYTGKVFSVEMPHQHVHQAFPGDFVVSQHQGSG